MSKFDLFVFENKTGKRFIVILDCAYNGVAQWFHTDGKTVTRPTGNKHIGELRKKFNLVHRIPEGEWRHQGLAPFIDRCLEPTRGSFEWVKRGGDKFDLNVKSQFPRKRA